MRISPRFWFSAIDASNSEPAFADDSATRTLPENSGAGVNVVGSTITASDDDTGNTLTYSLTGTDAGPFEIGSNGQIKTKTGVTPNLDFEAAKKSYSVTVQVADGKDAAGDTESPAVIDDTIAVTIDLTNVNEPPEITSTGTSHTEPSFAEIEFDIADADLSATAKDVVTYAGSDPDAGVTLTWSVSGTDKDHFTIDSTGKLSFSIRPNHEMPDDAFESPDTDGDNDYEIVVEVSDGLDETGSAENPAVVDNSINVSVTATNVDETPEVPAGVDDETFVEIEYDATTAAGLPTKLRCHAVTAGADSPVSCLCTGRIRA